MARKPNPDEQGTVTVGRSTAGTFIANAVGILFAVVMIFPVYWILNTAFKPAPEVLQFDPSFFPRARRSTTSSRRSRRRTSRTTSSTASS
jgi:ABC-type glycerol-3-phosphate transport system permease component